MILKVLTVPDPRLTIKAEPVLTVDNEIKKLMGDLVETMIAENGIGLAATQVGINKRVIVIYIPKEESVDDESYDKEENHNINFELLKMANPEIIWHSEDTTTFNEGCLSVPGQFAEVTRPAKVQVKFLDENNQQQIIMMEQLHAICVQHEIDHLDGKLFIDYLDNELKMQMINAVQNKK